MDSKVLLFGLCAGALAVPAAATAVVYRQDAAITVNDVDTGLIYSGTHDAELREDAPTTNYNEGTGSSSNPEFTVDDDDGGFETQAVVRFDDIFGDGPGQIPLGSIIHSATLFIDIDNTGDDLDLYRVTTDWGSESTVTWSTFTGGGISATTGVDTGIDIDGQGDKVDIDVTDQVALWAAGTANNGWAFLSTGHDGVDFDASEAHDLNDRPQLSIHYAIPEPGSLALLALGSVMLLRRR